MFTADDPRLGRFSEFERVAVYDNATSLECLHNLSALSRDSRLFIKRDDCNNLGFGGNKVRQVEYYFGDALASGADTVLITGAVQSNFVRITAALAARTNLQCHIQLESRVANESVHYGSSGNVLLNRLFGAKLHYFDKGEDEFGADNRIREIADELKAAGRKPYVIPLVPGHPPLGALGYIRAAVEMLNQFEQQDLKIDEIFVASGSGNTHAGILFGLRALNSSIRVVGVCVRRDKHLQHERIKNRCQEITDMLEVESNVTDTDIVITDQHFAPGYGKASREVWDSIILTAQKEGIVLDPTYTGKAMAAFLARANSADAPSNMLFLHTGGTPAIFGYQDQFEHALSG